MKEAQKLDAENSSGDDPIDEDEKENADFEKKPKVTPKRGKRVAEEPEKVPKGKSVKSAKLQDLSSPVMVEEICTREPTPKSTPKAKVCYHAL